MVFTDYWEAYQAVIPNKQHYPVGKETGERPMLGAGIIPCA